MTRLPIPLVGEPCNRCGECCQVGGLCVARAWDRENKLPIAFVGRCELLKSLPDGTTECLSFMKVDQRTEWFKMMVPGTCDYRGSRTSSCNLGTVTSEGYHDLT